MRRTIATLTTFLFLLIILVSGGCEVHTHPAHSSGGVVVYDYGYTYEEYCYESYDYCCVYYDYYDEYYEYYGSSEVCEVTECLDPHTDNWYYEGEECWYE